MDLMDYVKEAAEAPCPRCQHPAGRHTEKRELLVVEHELFESATLSSSMPSDIRLAVAACEDCGCKFFLDPDVPPLESMFRR